VSLTEVARVPLPTPYGRFETHAFESSSNHLYLAMVKGRPGGEEPVLTRIHSECLTGDVFGSLRCDCGIQLLAALKAIAAEDRGILLYLTGHEGRGVGLVNKLRAYVQQDGGLDTVDANLHLGLPVDSRSYEDAGEILGHLGVPKITLMTSNPRKVDDLRHKGIIVDSVRPLPISPHVRNSTYLSTKWRRLGHGSSIASPRTITESPVDVRTLIGLITPRPRRPYTIVKYAQSLDGRTATANGDSQWISGEKERAISHSMRAYCDAVLVGVGTVLNDDPQLTVRLVTGTSPIRVVLDSKLRIPNNANVLNGDSATIVVTTEESTIRRRRALAARGARVIVVPDDRGVVDLSCALSELRDTGIESLLVEGGAKITTSLLASRCLVDRLVVSIAPTLLGAGTEGIGDLGISRVASGLKLERSSFHHAGDDLLVAADVASEESSQAQSGSETSQAP